MHKVRLSILLVRKEADKGVAARNKIRAEVLRHTGLETGDTAEPGETGTPKEIFTGGCNCATAPGEGGGLQALGAIGLVLGGWMASRRRR